MTEIDTETALRRVRPLLRPEHRAHLDTGGHGYVDLLGNGAPPVRTASQRLMRTGLYSSGYQLLRPAGFRLASGMQAPGRNADRMQVAEWLCLQPGSVVVDVGCGPGNFTGWFGGRVDGGSGGVAVGVDASAPMLRRAVADNGGPQVVYLRSDAERLPFGDQVADAVCCLAALYLINDPFQAIRELHRILKHGGRMVILTTMAPRGVSTRLTGAVL